MDPAPAFKNQSAACGNTMDGERYEDRDEEIMVTEYECYACGCAITCHEYHDGSVDRTVVHHNGNTLVDELLAAH